MVKYFAIKKQQRVRGPSHAPLSQAGICPCSRNLVMDGVTLARCRKIGFSMALTSHLRVGFLRHFFLHHLESLQFSLDRRGI